MTVSSSSVAAQLSATLPPKLVEELLKAYGEAKRNFYLGGLRLSEVEAGRFCEAAFRILEFEMSGNYTPLGTALNTEKLIRDLANLGAGSYPDSIRLHIPRALRTVYDIRNKRDAAHLADGIDPNLQDASVVTATIDWALAELVRLHHSVQADEAQRIVQEIVTRAVPIVQDFDGFLKLLKPNLAASDHALVLLYQRGSHGATLAELNQWVRPAMRANLGRTLGVLVNRKDLAHFDGSKYFITQLGEREVEDRKLLEPA